MRILICSILLLSSFAYAKNINVNIAKIIKDDEGVKIIATDSKNKMLIYYLSQSHDQFAIINQKLQAAHAQKNSVSLDITEGELSLVQNILEIKK